MPGALPGSIMGKDRSRPPAGSIGSPKNLRAGKVPDVIARLKRLRPKTPELREKLQGLIAYYSEHAGRMRYDEYLRLGYGIGSGAWRARISRWCRRVSARPACAGVRPERGGYWRSGCYC